jgi:hypothetical protein
VLTKHDQFERNSDVTVAHSLTDKRNNHKAEREPVVVKRFVSATRVGDTTSGLLNRLVSWYLYKQKLR